MNGIAMKTRLAVLVGTALMLVLALSGVAWAAALAVTKTVPNGGATGIARTANVKAYFNNDIRASTVTSATFKIRKQGAATFLGAGRSVNNTISPTAANGGSQSVATLNPKADLASGTTYEVMIVGGSSGVKDVNGGALGANKIWTFTTTGVAAPPDTNLGSGPEGTVASDSATFTFSSSKAGSTFECSLDGSAFAGCVSPQGYTGLSQGSHTFGVRAIDGAGNVDATPATRSWTVDTVGPDASITDGPPDPSDSRSASFAFTGAEPGGGYQCKIDGAGSTGAFSPCTSGQSFTVDADGAYTFSVRASDALGNFGAAASRTWTIDTTPDRVTVTPNPLDFTPGSSACNTTITKTVTITNNTASQVDLFPSITRTSYSVASDELHIASGGSSDLSVRWSTSGGFKYRDAGILELKDAGGSTIATGDLTAFVFCPIEG